MNGYSGAGAEFNWNNYMGGGGNAGMPVYPQGQMGQMNMGGYGGEQQQQQQWLHSNQAGGGGSPNYQQAMQQSQTLPSPFEDYNTAAMNNATGQMGMNPTGNNYGGYPSGMSRNGLGNPSGHMRQSGGGSGYGGGSW